MDILREGDLENSPVALWWGRAFLLGVATVADPGVLYVRGVAYKNDVGALAFFWAEGRFVAAMDFFSFFPVVGNCGGLGF